MKATIFPPTWIKMCLFVAHLLLVLFTSVLTKKGEALPMCWWFSFIFTAILPSSDSTWVVWSLSPASRTYSGVCDHLCSSCFCSMGAYTVCWITVHALFKKREEENGSKLSRVKELNVKRLARLKILLNSGNYSLIPFPFKVPLFPKTFLSHHV